MPPAELSALVWVSDWWWVSAPVQVLLHTWLGNVSPFWIWFQPHCWAMVVGQPFPLCCCIANSNSGCWRCGWSSPYDREKPSYISHRNCPSHRGEQAYGVRVSGMRARSMLSMKGRLFCILGKHVLRSPSPWLAFRMLPLQWPLYTSCGESPAKGSLCGFEERNVSWPAEPSHAKVVHSPPTMVPTNANAWCRILWATVSGL